jgi:hypothetical protein
MLVENSVEKGLKTGAKAWLTVEKHCAKKAQTLSTAHMNGFPPLSTPFPQPFPQSRY